MKNEKWTVTISDGEMRVPYISEENTSFYRKPCSTLDHNGTGSLGR